MVPINADQHPSPTHLRNRHKLCALCSLTPPRPVIYRTTKTPLPKLMGHVMVCSEGQLAKQNSHKAIKASVLFLGLKQKNI